MRLDETACGVFAITPTPFTDDGALDLAGVPRLVDFYLRHRVHGLTILGMMGEANKLTFAEQVAFAEAMLDAVGGRIPVVVGASASALHVVRDLSHRVMDRGAAGVMVAPTPGLRGDDQVLDYTGMVMDVLGPGVPVVWQDYPQSTGVHLTPPLWTRIVDAFPGVVMLKHEDCPGLAKLSRIRADEATGRQRRVAMLIGNGGLYYPEELERGADGAMTGFAFPEMLVRIWELHRAGEAEAARDLFDAYLPLVRYEQQPGYGLAVRKETLRRRGALASATARRPGPSLGAEGTAELDRLITRLERRLRIEAPGLADLIAA